MTAWTNKIFTFLQTIMVNFKFNLNSENEITVGNKIEKRLLWGDNYEWRLVGIRVYIYIYIRKYGVVKVFNGCPNAYNILHIIFEYMANTFLRAMKIKCFVRKKLVVLAIATIRYDYHYYYYYLFLCIYDRILIYLIVRV